MSKPASTGHVQTVGVFCGAQSNIAQIYKDEAKKLGEGIGRRNKTLLYGGGTRGLMGMIAQSALEKGAAIIGVLPPCFQECPPAANSNLPDAGESFNEAASNIIDEIIVEDLHERKKKLLDAEAFFCFPGGVGTLDEITEVMAANDIGRHIDANAPLREVILVNINGYFDNLLEQLNKGIEEGFLSKRTLGMLHVVDSAKQGLKVLDALDKMGPRKVKEIGFMRPEYNGQIPTQWERGAPGLG